MCTSLACCLLRRDHELLISSQATCASASSCILVTTLSENVSCETSPGDSRHSSMSCYL